MADKDTAETAAQLRRVLDAVDAGEIEAEPGQRAYLAGAADALERVAGVPGNSERAVSNPSL